MTSLQTEAIWIDLQSSESKEKIKEYLNLPNGWHHGEGVSPNKDTVDKAIRLAEYAENNFLLFDSAPGLNGEIQLAIYEKETSEKIYLEVTIEPDRPINITRYEKMDDIWEITMDRDIDLLEQVEAKLFDFWKENVVCQDTSEYSQRNIILKTFVDTAALPLRTSMAVYQLYESGAFQNPEHHYADI